MNRRVADVGELFDLLDQIRNSAWISFGYVSSVKVNKSMPTKKIRNPQTNRMNTVNDFSMFSSQGEDEIATIVKVTSYNIQYRNRDLVARQYGNYIDRVNPIRVSYGLNPIAQKEKDYAEKRDFGNGIDVYNGNKEELKGHSYFVQNVHNAHPKSVYYAVNRQGRIIKELPKEQLKPYLEYSNMDGVDALKKLGAQDEMVKEFIKKVDDLKFVYRRFIHECILWVAATTKNGDRFTYINNNFNRVVDKINMNPQDFLAIARERYNIGVSDIESMANNNINENRMRRNVIRLTEADLHRIVKESVNKILRESVDDVEYDARDFFRDAEDKYLMQEKLPRGWEKHKCNDVFGGFIYIDEDFNEYYKDEYGHFQPLDNEF